MIRILTIALITRRDNSLLLHQCYDSVKQETFYRPLGGGVDFGETAVNALQREFMEEINRPIQVGDRLAVLENIYTFEDQPGHELALLYRASFSKIEDGHFDTLIINEPIDNPDHAVWRTLEQIKQEKANLYPHGLMELLEERGTLRMVKNLQLRSYTGQDEEFLLRLLTDKQVMKHLDGALPLDSARQLFQTIKDPQQSSVEARCVVDKTTGERIGHAGWYPSEFCPGESEILFILHPAFHKQGLGVKIVEQLVRLFFQETQNKLLYATVDCDNLPSIRILESCGMKIQSEHQEEGIPFLLYCLKREDTPVE